MSWDVILMSVPAEIKTCSEMPDNFSSTLGPASAVLPLLKELLPSVDLTDPTWGILDDHDFSIEFNIGKEDPIGTMMLHVRGGEAALGPIHHLCAETGWRAFDCTTSEFIDFSADPGEGLRQWQAYRDRVIASHRAEGAVVLADPNLPGVRVDAIVMDHSERRKWWQFWK